MRCITSVTARWTARRLKGASSASRSWRFPYATAISRSAPAITSTNATWNTITLDGSLPDQLVRDLIEDSYDLVVSAFPKRVREQLGWAPGTDFAASVQSP
jgi:hypothetical protein